MEWQPGLTSVQVQDFNWAGRERLYGERSYDFTRLGLEGVSAYASLFMGGAE